MLSALYDVGKLVIEEEYDGKSIEDLNQSDKISIYLDNDSIKNSDYIIYIDLEKNEDEVNFNKVTLEEFDPYYSSRLLYKKGSSRGSNLSPTCIITSFDKTYKNKFLKWFSNNKSNEFVNSINSELDGQKDTISNGIKDILEKYELCDSKFKIKSGKKVLLTIRINEDSKIKYLSDYPIFNNILIDEVNEKYYTLSGKKTKGEGICYLCDNKKELYGLVPSAIGLTFSTADKSGSLPGLNFKNQWKQIGICSECAMYLTVGKKFIEEHMNFSEFGLHYYVIPKFFVNPFENFKEIYDYFEDIESRKYENELVSEEDDLYNIVEGLNDILEFKFIYYEASNNSFKILGNVESLLPSWLQKIYKQQNEVQEYKIFTEENMKKILGEKTEGDLIDYLINNDKTNRLSRNNWYMGLLRFFMPYDTLNKYYLDTITSILSRKKVDFNFLLSIFMSRIRTNWNNESIYALKLNILRSFALIILLNDLDLFKGGNIMTNTESKNPLDMLDSDAKKASFLLGVLTRKLLNIQYRNQGSNPFMKKLSGLSLDYKKIQNLYPKIINKLREYDVAIPKLEGEITEYMLKSENNWNLTRDETSYYFTLGYTMNYYKNENEIEGDELNE